MSATIPEMANHQHFWKSPFSMAIWAMFLFAILFEPLRQILVHAQTSVNFGGVGGVGGLSNLIGCNGNSTDLYNFQGQYCFEKGSWGPFTQFEVLTIMFWVGPLLLACVLLTRSHEVVVVPAFDSLVLPVWIAMNVVWFAVPAMQFGLGLSEIEGTGARWILTLALAASHPLSWNLSLVVIPTGGVLSKLLVNDASKNQWFPFHRILGYTTAFWASLHGVGEMIYLSSTKERFRNLWAIETNGEVLLYWAGLVTLVLLVCHTVIAYTRRQWADGFQTVHRAVAAVLLLAAATHWWPFCLFLLPATALHGMAWATTKTTMDQQLSSVCRTAQCLAGSLTAALAGLYPIWWMRGVYMSSIGANLYVPFLFPPLSVASSTLAAGVWTRIFLLCTAHDDEANNPTPTNETPTAEQPVANGTSGEITSSTPLLGDV